MTDNAAYYEKYEPLKLFCSACGTEADVAEDDEIYCPKCEPRVVES